VINRNDPCFKKKSISSLSAQGSSALKPRGLTAAPFMPGGV